MEMTRLPWAAKNAVFKKLEEIADVSKLSREEREMYDVGLRKYRDTIGVLEGAHMEGEAKGFRLGMAKGRTEGRVEGRAEGEAIGLERGRAEARAEKVMMAKALVSQGMDVGVISSITGLSAEEFLS